MISPGLQDLAKAINGLNEMGQKLASSRRDFCESETELNQDALLN